MIKYKLFDKTNLKGIAIAGALSLSAAFMAVPSACVYAICAYSGDEVYWKVCKDLPKTTKLMIDGKALYIHRANFQIIDKKLLN